jgi:hypothetical protein
VAKVDRASLENLERKGGFKGLNQHAVSLIIAETDARKQSWINPPRRKVVCHPESRRRRGISPTCETLPSTE